MIHSFKGLTLILIFTTQVLCNAQTNPAISRWLQNTTITARHYVSGNSTPIYDAALANVQSVKYSATFAYATTTGLPSYVTGPFLDGNPNLAGNQNAIFKIPLTPVQNTGTSTATTGGNIGVFINGVALFDYRDGVSWQNSTGTLKGGPLGGTGDGVWNRDAVVGERIGFDCSKGHPAGTNYHHHQNPSAFNLDINVISTVCNLYAADGLYALDSTQHSPLIGFAYDGFPIYGAYGYKNVDGTGCIVRMKSSYSLRNIATRTTYSNGSTVTAGPPVNATYPLGYFREDYQYNTTSTLTPDYLDDHNGRFCVTPEYPNGIYCYFATVGANWNSAYPYVIGPTFYGVYANRKVTSITETVTTFSSANIPSVYIAACSKTICSGTSVTFTATTYNAGLLPSYQWKKNGVNVGSNSKIYSASSLANGDIISCLVTTATSLIASSNSITMTVNANVIPTVSITALSTSICSGTNVTFSAISTNGGNSPSFQWKKNGNNVGSNSNSYSDNSLQNNDAINCVLTSNATCATSSNATSNILVMIVNPILTPTVSITASSTSICSGTSVLFTATPTNGGSLPSFQWKKNGSNVGTNSSLYTDSGLQNNDVITCTLTSNAGCSTLSNAVSNSLTMVVNPCLVNLNLTLLIEGYYIGSGVMVPVLYNEGIDTNPSSTNVDAVTIELHSPLSPYSVEESVTDTLHTNGSLHCIFSQNAIGNSYYLVIKHRNSIETWSANPVVIYSVTNYDFTVSSSKAFGNNQKSLNGNSSLWGLFSGDNNQDNNIDLLDALNLETDINNFQFGYLPTDLNGDGNIDLLDNPILEDNVNLFIYSNHP